MKSETYSAKKLFIAHWYNYISQEECTEYIAADTLSEAAKIMVAIMQLYGGSTYKDDLSIDDLYEVSNPPEFKYKKDIEEAYRNTGKNIDIDSIKLVDEDRWEDD